MSDTPTREQVREILTKRLTKPLSVYESAVLADAACLWLKIQYAIQNEGPRPDIHREIMMRHRKEWPTLWAALEVTNE